jgi:hypothetical protein
VAAHHAEGGKVADSKNDEFAHELAEGNEQHAGKRWSERLIEIVEVIALATVAIATAWSGFQAAKWDGHQSTDYGLASKYRFEADANSTHGGQTLIADQSIFTAWLQAHEPGQAKLQTMLVKRFTPEYAAAFRLWLVTDPFNNPSAPPGPAYMPQYRNPLLEKAEQLNAQASATFDEGTAARDTAEKYVRDTVLFASVLFLVAVAQRFQVRGVRIATNVIASCLLVFTVISVALLPRL